ncbi:uncharacterized protein LOC131640549 [Vicia villosa]|uniref:uncharacterized protein LOC131640549 n=1 Tax=Vicia villosa TaxID=3911 RepID=UPI00273C9F95|nr:uncharacterized protein LOC131640549 [Vicia villosa]
MDSSKEIQDQDSCNWSNSNSLNPIAQQKDGACCFAFAICGVIEFLHCIEKNVQERILLSPQDIYDNLVKSENENAKGFTIPHVIEWVRVNGCVLESSCPYVGKFRPVERKRKVYLRITTSFAIDLRNDLAFKKAKHKKYEKQLQAEIRIAPVVAQMIWTSHMSLWKGDNVYSIQDAKTFENKEVDEKEIEYHAVMIVGFGQRREKKKITKYWIIKNSHGVEWGNKGYCKIEREPINGELLIEMAWILKGVTYKDQNGSK